VTICLDLLHTLFLGPMQIWCWKAIWEILGGGIWGALESTDTETMRVALMALQNELRNWYSNWPRTNPGESITQISKITEHMIGSRGEFGFETKAMETWGLMLFLLDMLAKYSAVLETVVVETLLESGRCLERYVRLIKANPCVLPDHVLQEMSDLWLRHMVLIRAWDAYRPKHHLMFHVNDRAASQGDPWSYHTFLDGSLNKVLKNAYVSATNHGSN